MHACGLGPIINTNSAIVNHRPTNETFEALDPILTL